jgi:hypothetical protein
VGELNHFLLGVVSKEVSRDVHYGDKACYGKNVTNNVFCAAIEREQQ